jgi:lysophospholipase L1-like esterase
MAVSNLVVPVANLFDDQRLIDALGVLKADHQALPLVKGNPRLWAVIGDSISANGGILPTGLRTQAPQGYTTWLSAISGQGINIEPAQNCSLSGTTSAQHVSTYLPAALALNPDICIVESGTNDPGGSITGDQTIANLTTIYTALLAQGAWVVAILILPRNDGTMTTAIKQQYAYVNRWIRRFASLHGRVICVDLRTVTAYTGTDGNPASGMTSDNIHPNAQGAYYMANQIWTQVKQFVSSGETHYPIDTFDTYDSVANITGNMMANGLFTTTSGGTIGTNSHSALTGTIPGSWSATFTGAGSAYTGTLAASVQSRSDGLQGKLVQLVATAFTGTGGGAQDKFQLFQQINFPTGLNVGDWVEGICLCNINATTGLSGVDIDIGISDGNGGTLFATGMGPYTNSHGFYQGNYSVVLKTPRIQVQAQAGATQRVIQLFANIYPDTSATGPAAFTVQLGNMCFRKVPV